ncbi:MAG: hypothetical protein IJ815_01205 [Lachnospiraceae bacterium]|nr:hypothetical protein [Lachnospiraceae bacterium]
MRKLDKFNKMIAMGAFCVGAAVTVMGCANKKKPEDEEPATIYGPPEMLNGTEYNPEDEDPEEIYGPPEMLDGSDYNPEDEDTVALYGPPDVFEDDQNEENSTVDTTD